MRNIYLTASIFGIAFCILRALIPEPPPKNAVVRAAVDEAEDIFAYGHRISLKNATMYELELIPGVSDTLAKNILEDREKIIKKAITLPPKDRHTALELAHGIGVKTAKKLDRYLEIQ